MKIRVLVAAVFLLVSTCAAADSKRYGAWTVDTSIPGFQIATTTDDADSAAGVICNREVNGCEAYVAPDIRCTNGADYPLMLNSSLGAFAMTSKCMHIGDFHVLITDSFDNMINAFESGGEIGVAIPMANGEFRVARFSTVGAVAAIKAARAKPAAEKTRTRRKNGNP